MVSIQDQIHLYDARIQVYSEHFKLDGNHLWKQFAGLLDESFWGRSESSKFMEIEKQLPSKMPELHRHNFLTYCQLRMCLEMFENAEVPRSGLGPIVAYMLAAVESLDEPLTSHESGTMLGGLPRGDTAVFRSLARYRLNQGAKVKEVVLDLMDPEKLEALQLGAGMEIVLVPIREKSIPTETIFYLNHRGVEGVRKYPGLENLVRLVAKSTE